MEFDAAMSEEDVHETMEQLIALGRNHNILFEKLVELEASQLSQPAKEAEALRLLIASTMAAAPSASDKLIKLLGPLLRRLITDLVRESSMRPDGTRAKPAAYTLPSSAGRAVLAAAMDVVALSSSRADAEKWMGARLAKYGIRVTTQRVTDWRDETVARMGKRRSKEKLLDVMVMIFEGLRPDRRKHLGKDDAEKLADQWLQGVKLDEDRGVGMDLALR
jgi:hypothetical protein